MTSHTAAFSYPHTLLCQHGRLPDPAGPTHELLQQLELGDSQVEPLAVLLDRMLADT
jgi:hypothetical protein